MHFLRENWRWLSAGALLTAGSGFGQTYFISLFSGQIMAEFNLTDGQWGLIYTIGTTLSAALMLWAGQLVDRFSVAALSTVIIGIFAATCLVMAFNTSALVLIGVIFGLRFCGQGMMSHIAVVAAGRWFAANRGRAVSVISLGFSAAEAAVPIIFVALTALIGWRNSWVIAALICLAVIAVLRPLLAQRRRPQSEADAPPITTGMDGRHWTRREAITGRLFWLTLPAFMAMPIFSTALFFQQVHLAALKGWPLASWVAMIPVVTGFSIITMLISGPLIDRFGSGRFLGFNLIPAVLAFVILWRADTFLATAAVFALMGMAQGVSGNIAGTFFPDYYGTAHLGAIRAVAASSMVFGSALGPGLTGVLIDWGWTFEDQSLGIAFAIALAALLAMLAVRLDQSRVRA